MARARFVDYGGPCNVVRRLMSILRLDAAEGFYRVLSGHMEAMIGGPTGDHDDLIDPADVFIAEVDAW